MIKIHQGSQKYQQYKAEIQSNKQGKLNSPLRPLQNFWIHSHFHFILAELFVHRRENYVSYY
jgi:hypothetical protein